MKKNLAFIILFISFLNLASPVLAQISLPNPLCLGGGSCANNFTDLISNIATYISGIVASLAVIMFIWAGILYLTSGANPGNVQKANKTVLYATIGLAIALAGAGLIQLVCSVVGVTCP